MTKKNKILITTSSFPKNKKNSHWLLTFCQKMSKKFDIYVLTGQSENSKFEKWGKIKIYRHNITPFGNFGLLNENGILPNIKKNHLLILLIPLYIISQIYSINKIVSKEKIDMIHSHWVLPQGLIAVIYKKIMNKKVKILCTIHGSDINNFNGKIGNLIKKFILKNINELSVVSYQIKEKVINLGYTKTINVFPMGIDTKNFNPKRKDQQIKKKYDIKGPFLLFVGTCIKEKGIEYLIKAIPYIKKKYPLVKLMVVGEGNLKESMISLTKKLKIKDSVIFLGQVDSNDLPTLYATADLFILPSFSEGFGLVVIEAISCGTIPLISNIPVFKHFTDQTKISIKLKNSKDISQKIIYFLKNKKKYQFIKTNLRKYVINNFDWDIVINNYTNLYKKII